MAPHGRCTVIGAVSAAVEFPNEEHDAPENEVSGRSADNSQDGRRTDREDDHHGYRPPGGGHREIEYLRLRYEKLSGFGGLGANDRLDEIYYRTLGRREPREPSERDLAYVRKLIALLGRQRSTLADRNLQATYAYGFWVQALLEEDFHPTVSGILRSLKDNLTLTRKQITALNAFFANRSGFPRLDPEAFSDVARKRTRKRSSPPTTVSPVPKSRERGRRLRGGP